MSEPEIILELPGTECERIIGFSDTKFCIQHRTGEWKEYYSLTYAERRLVAKVVQLQVTISKLLDAGFEPEVARLQAIVDQLPKDAEGNVYLPQAMEERGFHHPNRGVAVSRRFTGLRWDSDRWCVSCCGWVVPLSECYSTREAAEAAGGELDDPNM